MEDSTDIWNKLLSELANNGNWQFLPWYSDLEELSKIMKRTREYCSIGISGLLEAFPPEWVKKNFADGSHWFFNQIQSPIIFSIQEMVGLGYDISIIKDYNPEISDQALKMLRNTAKKTGAAFEIPLLALFIRTGSKVIYQPPGKNRKLLDMGIISDLNTILIEAKVIEYDKNEHKLDQLAGIIANKILQYIDTNKPPRCIFIELPSSIEQMLLFTATSANSHQFLENTIATPIAFKIAKVIDTHEMEKYKSDLIDNQYLCNSWPSKDTNWHLELKYSIRDEEAFARKIVQNVVVDTSQKLENSENCIIFVEFENASKSGIGNFYNIWKSLTTSTSIASSISGIVLTWKQISLNDKFERHYTYLINESHSEAEKTRRMLLDYLHSDLSMFTWINNQANPFQPFELKQKFVSLVSGIVPAGGNFNLTFYSLQNEQDKFGKV